MIPFDELIRRLDTDIDRVNVLNSNKIKPLK